MTETAALVTLNHPFKVGRGTLGKALPGREVRLSAEGEILVRGDMLAAGAWQGGHFRPRAEEWLATGDLGTHDANGELRFAGRRGEVIVTAAGMNVYPQDLEAALLRQPGVRGCAVVGCEVPDGAGGSEPVGIVLFAGDEAGLREATERANAELAAYQQLRSVLRWPEPALPYTSTGKLLRRQVAAWACEQLRHGSRTTEGQPPRDALLRLLEEVTREPAGATDDRSRLTEDLHLDSLGRVQLQAALEERFGIEVHDDRMAAAGTVAELRTLVGMPPEAAAAAISAPEPAVTPRVSATAIRYPRWPWSAPVRWLRAIFLETIAMPLVWLLANPRVLREPAVAAEGPLLLIANHVNTYDLPLLLYALGGHRRRWLTTAMSAEVLADLRAGLNQGNAASNLVGRLAYWLLLGLFNVFPLPRASGFRDSFAHAGAALDRWLLRARLPRRPARLDGRPAALPPRHRPARRVLAGARAPRSAAGHGRRGQKSGVALVSAARPGRAHRRAARVRPRHRSRGDHAEAGGGNARHLAQADTPSGVRKRAAVYCDICQQNGQRNAPRNSSGTIAARPCSCQRSSSLGGPRSSSAGRARRSFCRAALWIGRPTSPTVQLRLKAS